MRVSECVGKVGGRGSRKCTNAPRRRVFVRERESEKERKREREKERKREREKERREREKERKREKERESKREKEKEKGKEKERERNTPHLGNNKFIVKYVEVSDIGSVLRYFRHINSDNMF